MEYVFVDCFPDSAGVFCIYICRIRTQDSGRKPQHIIHTLRGSELNSLVPDVHNVLDFPGAQFCRSHYTGVNTQDQRRQLGRYLPINVAKVIEL